ncbi:MAG: SdpI family protein [Firmicutes bacterium]|nr:SdpI family protein [Bacillota bacterium]
MNRNIPTLSRAQLRRDWPLLTLLLILFALGIYFYPQLPERVPSHWNIRGEVDGYSSRFFGAFGLPLLNLGIYVLMLVAPALDPQKANYPRFVGAYNVIRWTIIAIMSLLHVVVLMAGLGYTIDAGKVVQPAVSVMFILIGNQMGRFRHNYFVGIKTPWTLANEEVWRRTHRVSGPIWVVGGFIGLLGTWLPAPYNFVTMMVAILGASLISLIYSYVIFKQITA